jgi:hypothetical protein
MLAVSAFVVRLIRTAFTISAVLSQTRKRRFKNDSSFSYRIMPGYLKRRFRSIRAARVISVLCARGPVHTSVRVSNCIVTNIVQFIKRSMHYSIVRRISLLIYEEYCTMHPVSHRFINKIDVRLSCRCTKSNVTAVDRRS